MISHDNCSHPSSSGERAKCRRARAKGQPTPTANMLVGPICDDAYCEHDLCRRLRPEVAKAVWLGKRHHNPDRERNTGQTPRDRHRECTVCGVEVIEFAGTDPVSGILLYVGERCTWRVEKSEDFRAVKA